LRQDTARWYSPMINLKFSTKFRRVSQGCADRIDFLGDERCIVRYALFIFYLFLSSLACGSESGTERVLGKWVVRNVVDVAPVAGLDDAELTAITGRVINFSSDEVLFQKRVCKKPTFTWSHKSPQGYFHSHKIKAPRGWRTPVDQLDVECAPPDTIGPFLLNGQDMMFVWYGALLHVHKETAPLLKLPVVKKSWSSR
jgi:hypothetical protein